MRAMFPTLGTTTPLHSARFGSQQDSFGAVELMRLIRQIPAGSEHQMIGRHADPASPPDLPIPNTPLTNSISRRHGEFWRDATGQLHYQDIGSKKGSTLNGNDLIPHQPVSIQPGDKLVLGKAFSLQF